MSFESYKQLYYSEDGNIIKPFGKPYELDFEADKKESKRYRLYVTGETNLFYQWKNEPDYPQRYRAITDSLDTVHAEKSRYCLNLSSEHQEDYTRLAYKKIMWKPVLSYLPLVDFTDKFTFGISVRTNKLAVSGNGYIRMRVAGYERREGFDPRLVRESFDFCYDIDLNINTGDAWRRLTRNIVIPGNTAHIGVWVEGIGYSGEIYVESPFITSDNGWNILPDFDAPVDGHRKFTWLGMNLSRVEWPKFRVELNGETVFEGERFERSHRFSEWEIQLPESKLKATNTLKIYSVSDYHDAAPYTIHEVGIIEQQGGELSIISVPDVGYVEDGVCVLIRTENDNTDVEFASDSLSGEQVYHFPRKGLHGLRLRAKECGENASFTLKSGKTTVGGTVKYICASSDKAAITGTGDMIYVNSVPEDAEEFLCWYISNKIGNMLTIRPTYRWCGVRVLKPEVWREVCRVLNEMQIYYVLMVDGRELPGLTAQPDDELLKGKYYLGSQTHERDGAVLYWGYSCVSKSIADEQMNDMCHYLFMNDKDHINHGHNPQNIYERKGEFYVNRDPGRIRDMRDAAEQKVRELALVKGNCTRHTGPASVFTPFVKSGFTWLGAETMYGTMEVQMAFLRGSCEANSIARCGAHHAVQWSSSPEDAPEHIRRYRLALYSGYIQGANDINTEEGLWHMEEYYSHFHRFSKCCNEHKKQQLDFYRFVQTHTRKGRFYTPVAFMQGRFDGWIGFTNEHPWGWYEKHHSEAENSWQLLKTLYPAAAPGASVYCHGCSTTSEPGYYSGTPYGNCNVLPAECKTDLIESYKLLTFMGYHCAEKEDFNRFYNYISNGGTLILTRAHLCNTTLFDDVNEYNITEISNHPLAMTDGAPEYAIEHYNNNEVKVCVNLVPGYTALFSTDEGTPLAAEYKIGAGRLILVNALCYPANKAIRPIYESLIIENTKSITALEGIWCISDGKTEFAVYDNDDGSRTIYVLSVDWYRPDSEKRSVKIKIGGHLYEIALKFGVLYKCVAKGNAGIIALDENSEIEGFDGNTAIVRTFGQARLAALSNGEITEFTLNTHSGKPQEIKITK